MKATITDIKRFAVHDGDGIRTTVFLKGCPLKCRWCHNPEGISRQPQLAFYEAKCQNCMQCVSICPQIAHKAENGRHIFDRDACLHCGKCQAACPREALRLYGNEMTVEQLLPLLLEDRDFYDTSGGGVTVSGGECLTQPDFCAALLQQLKAHRVHTAVDTCGYVSREALNKVIPYTDIFLYDIKAIDEDVHIRCTGQSNRIILENLLYLADCGKPVEVRIPYVPGFNDDQIEKIRQFLSPLKNITAVKVLAYHNYAGSKYAALGMENTLPAVLPTQEQLQAAQALFES